MKFNSFDGVSEQEIILMKKAIKKLQEPKSEEHVVTLPLGGSETVEGGPYRGFVARVPGDYAGIVTATIDDSWTITLASGRPAYVSDGMYFHSVSSGTLMDYDATSLHGATKHATFEKVEFNVGGAEGTPGIEFDVVMLKA